MILLYQWLASFFDLFVRILQTAYCSVAECHLSQGVCQRSITVICRSLRFGACHVCHTADVLIDTFYCQQAELVSPQICAVHGIVPDIVARVIHVPSAMSGSFQVFPQLFQMGDGSVLNYLDNRVPVFHAQLLGAEGEVTVWLAGALRHSR